MNAKILYILLFGIALFAGCIELGEKYECADGALVDNAEDCPSSEEEGNNEEQEGCAYDNPECTENYDCIDNECVLKEGCAYDNPECGENYECIDNECIVIELGCEFEDPPCGENYDCVENECILKEGCLYENPSCEEGKVCVENECKNSCENCNDPTLECVNNEYCDSRGSCSKDADCSSDEVCLGLKCTEVLDCTTSGSYCEDENFLISGISIIDGGGRITVKATIISKGDFMGTFRVVSNKMDSSEIITGTSYKQATKTLNFNGYIEKLLTGHMEHYLLEQTDEPNKYYLVERT